MRKSRKAARAMRKRQGTISIHGIQLPVPDELSIHSNSVDAQIRTVAEKCLPSAAEKQSRRPPRQHPPSSDLDRATTAALVIIATNAWRAKVKMVDAETGEAKQEMQRVYRHIEGIVESLKGIGIETIDPTGRAYDSGMALKVVSFEQTPGVSKEEIKETIKPSVSWQGRLIQMGEVIVGTPQKVANSERKTDEQNDN